MLSSIPLATFFGARKGGNEIKSFAYNTISRPNILFCKMLSLEVTAGFFTPFLLPLLKPFLL